MKDYLDYAASTPVSTHVLQEINLWETGNFANASSAHQAGRASYAAIQKAREVIAEKIGAMPSEIIFTSGASEANNLAIKGIAFKNLLDKGHIITSAIEHKCVLNTCAFLESIGFDVTYLQPNGDGLISPSSLIAALRPDTILISVHHVNNELGVIQPIEAFGEIAFDNGIPFHTDAAQSFCKLDINVDESNVDMLSVSGHKIFGPKGVGALYVREARSCGLVPLIHGGGQELGLRGGTLPSPLIVGFGTAVETFPTIASEDQSQFAKLAEALGLRRNGGPNIVPSIWNVTFKTDEDIKNVILDSGWLVSQGSACNAISNVPSHVLRAIGINDEEARKTYRISFPPYYIKG